LKKQKLPEEQTPLSQEELKAWWPFERLDPKRFPKQTKATETDPLADFEEALL
jgi:hypothetical protein